MRRSLGIMSASFALRNQAFGYKNREEPGVFFDVIEIASFEEATQQNEWPVSLALGRTIYTDLRQSERINPCGKHLSNNCVELNINLVLSQRIPLNIGLISM